ncbi:putative T6SS immunity periplasmic lipoprotein [Kosakonia sp. BK9b]
MPGAAMKSVVKEKSMLLLAVLMLTGCPGPGDRLPDRESAQVGVKENAVCIVYPVQPGDLIDHLEFHDQSGKAFYAEPGDGDFHPAAGHCLRTYGQDLRPAQAYALHYGVSNPQVPYRFVSAVFTTSYDDKGVLHIANGWEE